MELAQARKARIVPRTGGRALADALVAQGIDHVFAVPGESFLDVLDGLYDVRQKLKLVTCRFEAGAVNMAEAYGKLTRPPGRGDGDARPRRLPWRDRRAHRDAGQHAIAAVRRPDPAGDAGRDAFQEVDYRQMFGPLAKWVTQIDQAKRIPEIVAHAVDVATSGRPGPGGDRAVGRDAEGHHRGRPTCPARTVTPAHPDPAALTQLRAMLAGRASRWPCSAVPPGPTRAAPRSATSCSATTCP